MLIQGFSKFELLIRIFEAFSDPNLLVFLIAIYPHKVFVRKMIAVMKKKLNCAHETRSLSSFMFHLTLEGLYHVILILK